MATDYRVLFVCLGNICRSPCAEGVVAHKAAQSGLKDKLLVDSAGTGGWHAGDLPDHRMRAHAKLRGYHLDSRARQVRPRDFDDFDLIVAMDRANVSGLREFAPTNESMKKVRLFCEFAPDRPETEVPDPYYEGPEGFELVLDIVESAADGLLAHIRQQLRQK
jgi:protein-tyrosine phosphatase